MKRPRPWRARFTRWIYLTSLPIPYPLRTLALDVLVGDTLIESPLDLPDVRLLLDPADSLQVNMILDGYWDRKLSNWLAFFAPHSQTCADVGAHVGYFSHVMARYAPQSAVIHAFEPNPRTFAQLETNAKLNQLNLQANHCAVSDKVGMVEMQFPHRFLFGSGRMGTAYHAVQTQTLPSIDLDGYCDQKQISQIDLLKMDIEGAEVYAFAGMKAGMAQGRYGVLLVEMHNHYVSQPELQSAVYDPLLGAGYHIYHVETDHLRPVTQISAGMDYHCCAISPSVWQQLDCPVGEIWLNTAKKLPFAVGVE
jgi:FkbM family methyltransferase